MQDGLTHEQIIIACRNIGFDVTCGACASLFYTGSNPYEHDAGCKMPRSRMVERPPLVIEEDGEEMTPARQDAKEKR